jgi:uncharacterized protein (TIGR02145 family)
VNAAKNELCPAPWKVPAKDDFVYMVAQDNCNTVAKLTNTNNWGGSYSGYAMGSGMVDVGLRGFYWSSMDYSNSEAYALIFVKSSSIISPQSPNYRYGGFQVRCVK